MITLVEVEEFVDERTAARLWRSGEHARACWPAISPRLSVTLFSGQIRSRDSEHRANIERWGRSWGV